MRKTRIYDDPIPVRYFDPCLGIGSGKALGVIETPTAGKSIFDYIIDSNDHGLVMIWQKYILPEDK